MRRMSSNKPMWRKLLYIKQPFPDNYVDDSFLSQLKRNSTVQKYSYWNLASHFQLISLHLSTIATVYIVFFGLYKFQWDPSIPVSISTFLSILFYAIYSINSNTHSIFFKSSLLITLTILTLSPILKSLSQSTSSDSIWNLSFWLTLLNLILNNYHFELNAKTTNPSILSTNILISNVIVLASRLNSSTTVFCFILFAFEIHGLFPIFDIWLRLNHSKYHNLLTVVLHIFVNIFIYKMSNNLMILFFWNLIHFSILILAPVYFLILQQYKDELQGPWDPAKPIIN